MKQLNIRKIQSEEDIRRAKECVPEGCAEPNWTNCYLIEDGYEVIGTCGVQVIHKLEPLYMKKEDPIALIMAAAFVEGLFRAMGIKQYEFFIQDKFEKFQKFIENNLTVTSSREAPGIVFFRSLI